MSSDEDIYDLFIDMFQNLRVNGVNIITLFCAFRSLLSFICPSRNAKSVTEFGFPRSEYRARYKDTTDFKMNDKNYWATYFRTSSQGGQCDRIAKKKKKEKTYENSIYKPKPKNKNAFPPATARGFVKSPFVFDEYKGILYVEPKVYPVNGQNEDLLYDQLLKYKQEICKIVVDNFSKLESNDNEVILNVYFENEYPCIMVQVNDDVFKQGNAKNHFYKITTAYFVAITNKIAHDEKILIEIVNRASFGHNIPSVAETNSSFRINIGIVPEVYADKVLVKSLKILNNYFLIPFLTKNSKFILNIKVDKINDSIKKYNENKNNVHKKKKEMRKKRNSRKRSIKPTKVEYWREDEQLFDVLNKVGNSKPGKVLDEITRQRYNIELLTEYVINETKNKTLSEIDWAAPLRNILQKLKYKSDGVTLDDADYEYKICIRGIRDILFKDSRQAIANDTKFWELLIKISSSFNNGLNKLVEYKNIYGLNRALEVNNLEFIRNSNSKNSTDGYGSDSDCEVDTDNLKFYSKKVIVSTGMRAICLADYLLHMCVKEIKNRCTKFMYYQAQSVIKNFDYGVCPDDSTLICTEPSNIYYIDLNHCASDGPDSKVILKEIFNNLKNNTLIVFDYTSATTKRISKAIKLFIKKVPFLLLVNSGLKNEQVGADMNPYGTLRILAKNRYDLDTMYDLAIKSLCKAERMPKESHNIRKSYKSIGAVVTNASIFTEKRGYKYKPRRDKKRRTTI